MNADERGKIIFAAYCMNRNRVFETQVLTPVLLLVLFVCCTCSVQKWVTEGAAISYSLLEVGHLILINLKKKMGDCQFQVLSVVFWNYISISLEHLFFSLLCERIRWKTETDCR